MKTKLLKILLADDEPPARKKLRTYLADTDHIGEIHEAENGIVAADKITSLQPDLVFLDIQMPGMTGFEVIESVGVENMPAVVFCTAFDQYALDAFEVQAIDYLLKPFDEDRFLKALQRAVERIQQSSAHPEVLTRLLADIKKENRYLERIMVSKGSRLFFVKAEEISHISAEERYVKLHTQTASHLVRDTMSQMEKRLDPNKFARIHRSYIINIDYIKEMQPWSHGDFVIILKSGEEIPLSRRYKDRLFGRL